MPDLKNATGEHIAGPDSSGAELLNVKQTSAMLGASARTVYRLADAGKLPAPVRLGGLTRWRRAELLDWIAGGCAPVRIAKGGAR
jgi:excisionase family DNA binding protein